MENKQPKREPKRKPRPRIRRAIVDLLAAVDKSISAADEAKKARRELVKLAEQTEQNQ
jgi:hypothetical protein